jgi:deazaflavin-dependent oxidoreductase (nitroreductase family)
MGTHSGKARSVPVLYLEDGERLIVAGGNWGAPLHPSWSNNLLKRPQARVQIRDQVTDVQARLTTGEERARLWPRLLEIWPAYQDYTERSGRELRVFVLTPRSPLRD